MEKKEITRRIADTTIERNDRKCLACGAAFRLAQECDITVKQIGDICSENDIKIVQCQLGCFS